MVIATKGSIQLRIVINDGIVITALARTTELSVSAKIIARSIKSILNYHINSNPTKSKMDIVKNYFKTSGWKVED